MRLSRGQAKINESKFLDARGAGGAARPALSRIISYQSIPMHTPAMHTITINKGNNSILISILHRVHVTIFILDCIPARHPSAIAVLYQFAMFVISFRFVHILKS